jgi:heme/copper-type cytochrome/quinol oxidase subunit 2
MCLTVIYGQHITLEKVNCLNIVNKERGSYYLCNSLIEKCYVSTNDELNVGGICKHDVVFIIFLFIMSTMITIIIVGFLLYKLYKYKSESIEEKEELILRIF